MMKMITPSEKNYYNQIIATYNMSDRYGSNLKWKQLCMNLVEEYISNKKCIIYGSRAIELSIQQKQKHFKMKVNDIDILSVQPKQDAINIYNILIKKEYCWSVRISHVPHHNIFSIFVNEIKLVDLTHIQFETFKNILSMKVGQLKICSPYFSLMDLYSIISDKESIYLLQKTLDKMEIIQNYYTFKYIENVNEIEPTFTHLKEITNEMDSPFNIIIDYKKMALQNNTIKINQNGDIVSENSYIHTITNKKDEFTTMKNDLPTYCKYTQVTPGYFFTGSVAARQYGLYFKTNIYMKNNYEIYVTDINFYIKSLCKLSKLTTVEYMNSFKPMYTSSVKLTLEIDNMSIQIYLYELTKMRQYVIIGGVRCSCINFLHSHNLMNATCLDRDNYQLYINTSYVLLQLHHKYHHDDIFKNDKMLDVGILESQHRANNKTTDDMRVQDILKINIYKESIQV